MGLFQIITYSFVPVGTAKVFGWGEDDPRGGYVPLQNPLSEEQGELRTSLLHGLVSTLEKNVRQGADSVRLFEWGRVFFPADGDRLLDEESRLAGLVWGAREPVGWYGSKESVDLWDIKGPVEQLLASLGLRELEFQAAEMAELQPGTAANVLVGQTNLGWLGEIKAEVLKHYDIDEPVFVFDLSADALHDLISSHKAIYQPLPRFPSITLDTALVVDQTVEAGRILEAANEIDEPLVAETVIFDLYQGKPLPPGKKSVGLRVRYLSSDKTLTYEEIAPVHQRLTDHLTQATGGEIRK